MQSGCNQPGQTVRHEILGYYCRSTKKFVPKQNTSNYSPTSSPTTMTLSSRFHHPLPDSVQKSTGTEEPIHKSITSPRGTLPFLRPTHAHVHFDNQKLDWNSRDHRKGRHPLEHNKRRHISTILRLEWWNISWWVAFVSPFGFKC